MSKAIEILQTAQKKAMQIRPEVGGFPYLAEVLRLAGVTKNTWTLPACEALYITNAGPVVVPGNSLVTTAADIPAFNQDQLITALRVNQNGKSTFPEFLVSAWQAGVVRYDVDFLARHVSYYGCNNEIYVEKYPQVEIKS